jgi:hypothetical protein
MALESSADEVGSPQKPEEEDFKHFQYLNLDGIMVVQ